MTVKQQYVAEKRGALRQGNKKFPSYPQWLKKEVVKKMVLERADKIKNKPIEEKVDDTVAIEKDIKLEDTKGVEQAPQKRRRRAKKGTKEE